jgi:hypothetical protein
MPARGITITLLLLTALLPARAQSEEQTILKLEEELHAAMLSNGVATFERLVDKDFLDVNQFGQQFDRAGWITLFKTFKPGTLERSAVKVQGAGDAAHVKGKLREISTSNSGRPQFLLFLHVWIKRADGWKLLIKQQQFDHAEGTITPTGWNGTSNAYFLIGTDTAVKYSGKASAFVKSKHNETSAVSTGLSQQIKADNYRGKRLRLDGWVKGEVNSGYAHCWMRVDDAEGEVLSFDNTLDEGNVLKPDWARFSIVLDVPEKAAVIYLGFQMVGRGQVWLDDWQLEVVGKDIASTNQVPSEARQKQMQTMRTMNRAQWEQQVQAMKTRLPTLPTAPVNLDFESQ